MGDEKITMDREYVTRDGREVRIYAVDGGGRYPVHGAILIPLTEDWFSRQWTADGVFDVNDDIGLNGRSDLIPKPRKHTLDVWVNVNRLAYGEPAIGGGYRTKKDADYCASACHRIACKKITIEVTEGEGLAPPSAAGDGE